MKPTSQMSRLPVPSIEEVGQEVAVQVLTVIGPSTEGDDHEVAERAPLPPRADDL